MRTLLIAIALPFLLLPQTAIGAPGSLDPSFGGDGRVVDRGAYDARSVAIQSDRRILVVSRRALIRYRANGALDRSFGVEGRAIPRFGGNWGFNSVAVQPNGRIVAVGSSDHDLQQHMDMIVARFRPDGRLDRSFSSDGKVVTRLSVFDVANAVAIQPDGKILVGGYSDRDLALVRYNTDGSLDTAFDGDGKVTTAIGDRSAYGNALALLPDGRIVLAGVYENSPDDDFALALYETDGSLDTSFDSDGVVTTDLGGYGGLRGVAVQSDVKIVAVGGSSGGLTLARYELDGSLDTSFDSDGVATTDFGPNSYSGGEAIVLQPDDKIVAVGTVAGPRGSRFAIARYNPNGGLDTSFDLDGMQSTRFARQAWAYGAALQPNGKIVAVGQAGRLAMARYLG